VLPNRAKKLKIICSLVMLAAIALMPSAGMSNLQAQEDDVIRLSPLNPDFVKLWEEPPETLCDYIPPPMDLSHLDAIPVKRPLKSAALPDSFDWRDQGKVTPIKDQLPCATCWIFGLTSVLESAVLLGEDAEYDFSEQSVALCVDRSWVYLYDDADEPCGISHGGGWSALAAEVLIKKGAVLESCNSYNSSGLQCNGACLCDNCTPIKTVDGYRLVTNDQSQTDLIKEAVYGQGLVTMAYYKNGAHQYTDNAYGTVYDCAACPVANHMVSIIGWDDSVPHFETSGTGAWLVKNSWGTASGNSGYFWLAYDSSCMTEIAYVEYKDYDPNEKLYYWDEAGWVDDYGYEAPSAWMADIFASTQDGILTHVDFWTTSNNAQYDIYVYLDGDISNGLQNQVAFQRGTCQESGYYSVPLTSPVSLTSGQSFAIAVRMTTPGYDCPIPVEEVIEGLVEPQIQGETSYARSGDAGSWDDLASQGFNACLRARVRTAMELSILTTHLSDGMVGEAYEETMEATGGAPPYPWEATGLPDGLNCSAAGVISGTPTEEGDFTVAVTVTDSFDPANTDGTDLALKVHPAATATVVTVEPASNKVGIGDSFVVDVFVDPDTDIAVVQFSLNFSPSAVTANGVTEGNLLSQGGALTFFVTGTIDNLAGTITNVAGAITTPGASVSASGTFATISFTAGTSEGTSALDLSDVIVGNLQGQPVDIEVTDGGVTVCPDWDVNLDESVNVLDMILLGQHWGETGAAHWIREDAMRDGEINVLDMIPIGQHWTG
jgi:C1A family cysteine protease